MLKRNPIKGLLMFIQTPDTLHGKFGACQKWEPASQKGD